MEIFGSSMQLIFKVGLETKKAVKIRFSKQKLRLKKESRKLMKMKSYKAWKKSSKITKMKMNSKYMMK